MVRFQSFSSLRHIELNARLIPIIRSLKGELFLMLSAKPPFENGYRGAPVEFRRRIFFAVGSLRQFPTDQLAIPGHVSSSQS